MELYTFLTDFGKNKIIPIQVDGKDVYNAINNWLVYLKDNNIKYLTKKDIIFIENFLNKKNNKYFIDFPPFDNPLYNNMWYFDFKFKNTSVVVDVIKTENKYLNYYPFTEKLYSFLTYYRKTTYLFQTKATNRLKAIKSWGDNLNPEKIKHFTNETKKDVINRIDQIIDSNNIKNFPNINNIWKFKTKFGNKKVNVYVIRTENK